MSNKPYLVLSLDFEMFWGMFDKVSLDLYGPNIAGEHTLIPKLLRLLEENDIRCTWATVGLLAARDKAEMLELLPDISLQPIYPDQKVSAYHHLQNFSIGESAIDDKYHYGRHLIEAIVATPNQELASHTFSHYYCIDGEGNSKEIFAADCRALAKALAPFNQSIRSIVFPRNQVTEQALQVVAEQGLTSYRGTPDHFLYTAKNDADQSNLILRLLRLIDAYLNLTGHHTFKLSPAKGSGLVNVRGSRFLRSYSKTLRSLEWLKLRRIKNSMTYAAKRGEVFHLWWHPHNFGINQEANLSQLQELIKHYHYLKETYGMESQTMAGLAKLSNESAA